MMNSLGGSVGQPLASLAVVTTGIAESLIATAAGLASRAGVILIITTSAWQKRLIIEMKFSEAS